jgi:hypothetical protein
MAGFTNKQLQTAFKAAGVNTTDSQLNSARAKVGSGGGSSTPAVNPTGPLANGASMSLNDFGSFVNQMGIATPNWSPSGGLNKQGQALLDASKIGTQAPTLPPKPMANINPAGYMADYTNNLLQAQNAQDTQTGEANQAQDVGTVLSQYLGQPERTDRQAIEKQAGVNQLAQQTRDTEAQINMINANNQAAIMQVRNQSSLEGGTIGILSSREDALNRSAATKLLPLTALYQAQIGNLNAAKEQVNTYIADENAYQERVYRYKKDVWSAVSEYANAQQKRQWDLQDQQLQMNLTNTKELNSVKGQMFNAAMEAGQSTLAQSIWKSTTLDEVYQKASGLQISRGDSVTAPIIKSINGQDMQWNPSTGTWENPSGSSTTSTGNLRLAQAQGNIQLVDSVLNNPALTSSVGPTMFSRIRGKGLYALTGQTQDFTSSVQQLTSQLSLDSLIRAKANGATFGALSEGELKLLSASASKIDSWAKKDGDGNYKAFNVSEKAFKQELDRINNLAKLDYLLKGGSPQDINVQVLPDGTYWTKNNDGTLTELQ